MIKVYVQLAERGLRNFNSIPKSLQKQVKEIIESDGYIINEDGTITKYFEEDGV